MSATGPFENILSERAALLDVVAGAVATVAEDKEPDDSDGMELEEEVKVAGGVPAEVPEVTETVGSGIEELLNIMEDVPGLESEADELEEVAIEGKGDPVMGPGPRLNRKNK